MSLAHPPLHATALPRRVILPLHDRQGDRIDCLAGRLWITQEGDRRDVVLEAGEGFTLDRPGLALVSALVDAQVTVRRPGTSRRGKAAGIHRLGALFHAARPG